MIHRRELLTAAGASAATLALGRGADSAPPKGSGDGTWLTYAVNVEMTWGRLPFLERLRKVKEAGFSHYEFWPWRNKDIDAIVSLNRELGLVPAQFSASPDKGFGHGITNPDPARRQEFEEEIRSAVPIARKLGVKKICVVAGEETAGASRDEQTQAVITALKAGDDLGRLAEFVPKIGRALPELEADALLAAELLDLVGPDVLADCAQLDLDRVAASTEDQVHRAVSVVLRVLDVVALAEQRRPRLEQPPAHGVDRA